MVPCPYLKREVTVIKPDGIEATTVDADGKKGREEIPETISITAVKVALPLTWNEARGRSVSQSLEGR